MNCNALTILDMKNLCVLGTVLLDQTCRGAPNPWAVEWSFDGKKIAVSHAGTPSLMRWERPWMPGSSHSNLCQALG